MVPPEAQLSQWSSSTTGPLPAGLASARALARAIEAASGSIAVDELLRAAPRPWPAARRTSGAPAPRRRRSPRPPTGRRTRMSAFGKPTNTLAHSAPCGLHLAAARLHLAVGRIVAALAHHVRQHRPAAPGHGRLGLAGQHAPTRRGRRAGRSRTCPRADRSGSRRSPWRARPSRGRGWCACPAPRRSAPRARPRGCGAAARPRRRRGVCVTIAPCRSSSTASQPCATASQMRPAISSKAASSTGPLGQALRGDRQHRSRRRPARPGR